MENGQNVRTAINNGTLSSLKAMPQKDITSDGTSSFSINRKNYYETYAPAPSNDVWKQKKFIGGNRDASSIVAKRRATEIGTVSLNANSQPLSFTTTRDINTTNNALRRVRAGGSYVPPRKTVATSSTMDPRKYIF
jgi:hypothetical protein